MSLPTAQLAAACHVLAQVGATGVWGRFVAAELGDLQVGDTIVCQTGRGLELGRVRLIDWQPSLAEETVGPVVRRANDSDLLTWQRITAAAPAGIEACNRWLANQGFPQMVLDVDVPLDGMRLYFHFLGDVDDALDDATATLVEQFDQATGIRRFTQAVITGCGPNCGSDGSGCGTSGSCSSGTGGSCSSGTGGGKSSGGCGSCALRGGCGSKSH